MPSWAFVYERIRDYYGDVDEVKTACLAAFKRDSPERFIEMWAAVQDVLPVSIGHIGFLEFENDMLGLNADNTRHVANRQ